MSQVVLAIGHLDHLHLAGERRSWSHTKFYKFHYSPSLCHQRGIPPVSVFRESYRHSRQSVPWQESLTGMSTSSLEGVAEQHVVATLACAGGRAPRAGERHHELPSCLRSRLSRCQQDRSTCAGDTEVILRQCFYTNGLKHLLHRVPRSGTTPLLSDDCSIGPTSLWRL